MALVNVLFKGWTIHSHVNSFFDGSSQVLALHLNHYEVISGCFMTCGVTIVIYRAGSLRCSLNPSPYIPEDSPIHLSSQSTLPQLSLYKFHFPY